jgi:uracil-DNA glycosylase
MRVNRCVHCTAFPCADVDHDRYSIPSRVFQQADIGIVMISEVAAPVASDGYYTKPPGLFAQTTVHAFRDAGADVHTIDDIVGLGVYLTTAVKCAKTSSAVATATIEACSHLLERELALFPNARAYLLMGDVAIRSLNAVARRLGEKPPVPRGSTYKIRKDSFYFQGKRVFPSYLQAGPSFLIERSKRAMIAEDISAALALVRDHRH